MEDLCVREGSFSKRESETVKNVREVKREDSERTEIAFTVAGIGVCESHETQLLMMYLHFNHCDISLFNYVWDK